MTDDPRTTTPPPFAGYDDGDWGAARRKWPRDPADKQMTLIEAVISRLSALCDVGDSYDDEDMSVRQGDLKAILVEIQCLRTENDELQATVDGLQSIINRAKANGGNIYA